MSEPHAADSFGWLAPTVLASYVSLEQSVDWNLSIARSEGWGRDTGSDANLSRRDGVQQNLLHSGLRGDSSVLC